MHIALVFPKSTFLIDPMVYPPLGLWYIAAQLEALGHTTEYFDLSVDEVPADGDFDQIWVSATSAQMHSVKELADHMWNYTTPTVLGGPAVWANPLLYKDQFSGFNLLVSGEVDHPERIDDILRAATLPPPNILKYDTLKGLDHVLPPVRRWANRYNANLISQSGREYKTTTMFTSRGCPMACAFCESGRNGIIWDKFVRYEPEDVVLQQFVDIVNGGFEAVQFYDDILPIRKDRMRWMMERLQDFGLKWRCFIRTDIITKQGGYEYLKEMKKAGLVEVLAGIESADNRIKDNIMKGTTIEMDTQVMEWCKDLGITFKASIILGLPGESMESMETTREWILKHRPDRVDVNTLIPFPGTPLTNPLQAHKFDLQWTEKVPEEFWYKGPRDETQALTSTSNLTSTEIKAFHTKLMAEIKELGIPY